MKNKRFPLFIDLKGRKAVVIGGGPIGLRRAGILRDFGAEVTVISPTLHAPSDGLCWLEKTYSPNDLTGAYIVIAATNVPDVNAAAGRAARALGAFFNRSDDPSDCDFFFPAICEGEHLLAGVTGDATNHKQVAEAAKRIRTILTGKQQEQTYLEEKP